MKNKSGIKRPLKTHLRLRPSTVLACCVVWSQLLSGFPSVLCGSDGFYVPSPYQTISPEMFRVLQQHGQHQQRSQFLQNLKSKLNGQAENAGDGSQSMEVQQHKSGDSSGRASPETSGANKIASYGEHPSQQLQQLLPTELLYSQQFPKSTNPMIFNQANGPFMEKEPLDEGETSNHLGLYSSYNDYDLIPKQVIVRSRPSGQFFNNPSGGGTPVKRSQSLAAAREGYMCHFKLCQFGSSGKRRWSPLFEFD